MTSIRNMTSIRKKRVPGQQAITKKGWFKVHKYLILRRLSLLFFVTLFLSPVPAFLVGKTFFGDTITNGTIAQGTIATSRTLNILPLTDPFIALQSFAAQHMPEMTMLMGALFVLLAYWLLGGKTYCAWACPINPVTDLASWVRRKLNLDKGLVLKSSTRYGLLIAILVVSFISGTIAWEIINPITTLHRMMLFGFSWMVFGVLAIFLFDVLIAKNGWCGHLCPVGAFYGLIGKVALLRVSAPKRADCDDCLDCYIICPEPQVISPALRGEKKGSSPVILSGDCTVCGRCVDICHLDIFRFTHRFDTHTDHKAIPESVETKALIP